jgi:hypothetical protein
MTFEQVEKDLEQRIVQSREWVAGKPGPIRGLKAKGRNFTFQATPYKFIDDDDRLERNGVGFSVETEDSSDFRIQIDVRIKEHLTEGPKEDSPPYVCAYVINQVENKALELLHVEFQTDSFYSDLFDCDISEWYRNWLRMALLFSRDNRLFRKAMRITPR